MSGDAQPTPGPWVNGPYGDIWIGVQHVDGKWCEVAPGSAVIVASVPRPEDRPMIAAAPAMYPALKAARVALIALARIADPNHDPSGVENGPTIAAIDAALAAAEGRQT